MSKVIPSGLLAHYQQDHTSVAVFIKITLRDTTVIGYTSTDQPVVVSGVTYIPGFEVSQLSGSEGLNVDNLELTILPDQQGGTVTALDLLTGRWAGAFCEVFAANYQSPADGVEILKRGYTGEVTVKNGQYVVEFRSLAQLLQQPQGQTTQPTCRNRLGDALCTVDLGPYTVTGTLTAITSQQVFADSARAEAADYFGEGVITFTSGANAGYSRKVKDFAAGVFTCSLPFPFAFELGDAYSAVAGCRKRHQRSTANPTGVSDCIDKFNNILNFRGEPHLQGVDALTKVDA